MIYSNNEIVDGPTFPDEEIVDVENITDTTYE